MGPPAVRPLRESDSFAELTELIHRAYAPLAASGQRFLGSYQDEATTRRRCGEGECWVAVVEGLLVGTITWRFKHKPDDPGYYRRPGVAVFCQLAVDPGHQRTGIGSRLLDTAEARAKETGLTEMACDTSERAKDLIAYYARRGYREVGRHQWEDTNYESVLLSKPL